MFRRNTRVKIDDYGFYRKRDYYNLFHIKHILDITYGFIILFILIYEAILIIFDSSIDRTPEELIFELLLIIFLIIVTDIIRYFRNGGYFL